MLRLTVFRSTPIERSGLLSLSAFAGSCHKRLFARQIPDGRARFRSQSICESNTPAPKHSHRFDHFRMPPGSARERRCEIRCAPKLILAIDKRRIPSQRAIHVLFFRTRSPSRTAFERAFPTKLRRSNLRTRSEKWDATIRNKLFKATCVASALTVSAGYCSIRAKKLQGAGYKLRRGRLYR